MDPSDFAALHRYFIWANKMRTLFDKELSTKRPDQDAGTWFADSPGMLMSYWYAGLFVVIEGYRDLGCTDPLVDSLLRSPNVELLRRYRNGAFHFQRSYFDDRFLSFMSEQGTVEWVRELNRALGGFFLRTARALRSSGQENEG
jgi:hypothetical protein